jgi:L-amino acid N-acyltransferase YncA
MILKYKGDTAMVSREIRESDYLLVITVLNEWWDGRQMADMLPRLFFKHFRYTSFIVEENEQILGFLIGFISQTYLEQAYIHFIGIHPEHRGAGIGKKLYSKFFETVKEKGCKTVHLVTSPINQNSIAYHLKMGFEMEKGDIHNDGVWVHIGYDGPQEDRVLFTKKL